MVRSTGEPIQMSWPIRAAETVGEQIMNGNELEGTAPLQLNRTPVSITQPSPI